MKFNKNQLKSIKSSITINLKLWTSMKTYQNALIFKKHIISVIVTEILWKQKGPHVKTIENYKINEYLYKNLKLHDKQWNNNENALNSMKI